MTEQLKRLLEREGTGISWADLTMNFWIGCQEVSPACDHCYAREFTNARVNAARAKAGLPPIVWGPGGARQQTAPANRRKPLRWNRIAAEAGKVLNVFCSSLSDWADNAVPDEWRAEIAETIRATPHLRWMLLTKRIGNARAMLEAMFPDGVPENVALGLTIANQAEADRDMPKAVSVKNGLGIRRLFVSAEPLLGPLDVTRWLAHVDLVIVGGESGKDARPMHPGWVRRLRDDCAASGSVFHMKQWGEWAPGMKGSSPRYAAHWAHDPGHWSFYDQEPRQFWIFGADAVLNRVGVNKAGHRLDGREHREHFA